MGIPENRRQVAKLPETTAGSHPVRTLQLLLISGFGLFLELLLIRWIGTEVRVFAYLQNTVLVVCFLALGVGCWTCRQPATVRGALYPLLALVALLVPVSWLSLGPRVSRMLSPFSDLLFFFDHVSMHPVQTIAFFLLGLGFAFIVLVLVWDTFVPIGRLLGRAIADHPQPLRAYSLDLIGSLAGVVLFTALCALALPPVVWVVVAMASALALTYTLGTLGWRDIALAGGVVVGAWAAGGERGAIEVAWSPYQKLAVHPGRAGMGDYMVSVNNCGGFQWMIDLSPATQAADPGRYPMAAPGLSEYDLPTALHPHPRKVLTVGAGSGNGTAAALRRGADEVVAVEIDPVVIGFGRRHHPEQPYSDPRVRVVNDDARAFFANSSETFDVVSMEWLDSHTTGGMTNARLDHYVYTRESFAQARKRLAPGGVFFCLFACERQWVADRTRRAVAEAFGQEPLTFLVPTGAGGPVGTVFVAGDLGAVRRQVDASPALTAAMSKWAAEYPLDLPGTTEVATDDWPYIYLESRQIPVLYLVMAGLLVALFARGWRQLPAPARRIAWGRSGWHFFFLGAAFMLLEVQNVSKAAVLLGSTWQVNAVVVIGVLGLSLVANAVASVFPRTPLTPVYLLLVGACGGLYFLDLGSLAGLPYAARVAVVGGVLCFPVLFSGVAFARSFAGAEQREAAFGANLIGALAGGLLQAVTFLTGTQALLLIVAGLYVAAWATQVSVRRKSSVSRLPSELVGRSSSRTGPGVGCVAINHPRESVL